MNECAQEARPSQDGLFKASQPCANDPESGGGAVAVALQGAHARGACVAGQGTGQDLVVRIAIKPTSSIRMPKASIDRAGAPTTVETFGRHDPCVGIRATPIAESLLALVLMDHALLHRAQCGDVQLDTPPVPAQAPTSTPGSTGA